jgi:hypothetical protein
MASRNQKLLSAYIDGIRDKSGWGIPGVSSLYRGVRRSITAPLSLAYRGVAAPTSLLYRGAQGAANFARGGQSAPQAAPAYDPGSQDPGNGSTDQPDSSGDYPVVRAFWSQTNQPRHHHHRNQQQRIANLQTRANAGDQTAAAKLAQIQAKLQTELSTITTPGLPTTLPTTLPTGTTPTAAPGVALPGTLAFSTQYSNPSATLPQPVSPTFAPQYPNPTQIQYAYQSPYYNPSTMNPYDPPPPPPTIDVYQGDVLGVGANEEVAAEREDRGLSGNYPVHVSSTRTKTPGQSYKQQRIANIRYRHHQRGNQQQRLDGLSGDYPVYASSTREDCGGVSSGIGAIIPHENYRVAVMKAAVKSAGGGKPTTKDFFKAKAAVDQVIGKAGIAIYMPGAKPGRRTI